MSDFERYTPQPRYQPSGGVWSIAALAAFASLLSVLGAKVLSNMVDSDMVARSAYDRAMRDVAANAANAANASAPRPAAAQSYSVVRSVGIDGVTTATIPLRKAAPVSPCGDEKGSEGSRN